jgi:hypothetical protein
MSKFEQSAMVAVCGVLKEIVMAERERSREALEERERERERERKWGEKKERGPVMVINWDPYELSLDLNLAWIQKHAKD